MPTRFSLKRWEPSTLGIHAAFWFLVARCWCNSHSTQRGCEASQAHGRTGQRCLHLVLRPPFQRHPTTPRPARAPSSQVGALGWDAPAFTAAGAGLTVRPHYLAGLRSGGQGRISSGTMKNVNHHMDRLIQASRKTVFSARYLPILPKLW